MEFIDPYATDRFNEAMSRFNTPVPRNIIEGQANTLRNMMNRKDQRVEKILTAVAVACGTYVILTARNLRKK